MREHFQQELAKTKEKIITMGTMVNEGLDLLDKALEGPSVPMLQAIGELEEKVFVYDREVEQASMLLLLQQQPVASDLRLVTAMLKMHRSLLRMAMQIFDAASLWEMVEEKGGIPHTEEVRDMLVLAQTMVVGALKSFEEGDERLGRDVIKQDDAVDELFEHAKKTVVKEIKKGQIKPEVAINSLLMSKYFEKIGDHACEVAAYSLYVITGQSTDTFFT